MRILSPVSRFSGAARRQPDGAWACRKVFARRVPQTADFRIDGAEFDLYRDITRFVKPESARTGARGDDPRAVGFLMSLFQRRPASSISLAEKCYSSDSGPTEVPDGEVGARSTVPRPFPTPALLILWFPRRFTCI